MFNWVKKKSIEKVYGFCYLRDKKKVIPPGIEPGTLSVLDSRDNHYTMESTDAYTII